MEAFNINSARNLKSSLADITRPEKPEVEYVETDTEKKIEKQKTEFLTLLTTQLKNQDPFQPMDTNQMSQQIFAINQVEQQLETNKMLKSIHDLLKESHLGNSVNYIGKSGFYEGNSFVISDNAEPISLRYIVDGDPSTVKIKIFNTDGKEVHSAELEAKSGRNTYSWKPDAEDAAGVYKFNIETSKKKDTDSINVKTYGFGKISGIINEDSRQYFEINGEKITPERFSQLVDNT